MPDRLSLRSTLVLVVLAFGFAFAIQAPLGGDSSAAESAVKPRASEVVANTPAAEPDLSLTTAGTVPALRDARQPRKRHVRARKPARKKTVRRGVKAAPKLAPAPVSSAAPRRPMRTAAPRGIAPASPRSTPAPKPKPAPTPASGTSGEFDSSGAPSSEFDSSGEP